MPKATNFKLTLSGKCQLLWVSIVSDSNRICCFQMTFFLAKEMKFIVYPKISKHS